MRKKSVQGSVSIFLALTISLMLSFCMVLIESARENTMLLKADMVFDTGVQCLMAEYHRKLWEDYDLLYVDCSYGTESPSYGQVKEHLKRYIDENLKYEPKGWFSLDYDECLISDVVLATDFSAKDFYMQAVECAEASVGITYIKQALGWLEQVESTQYVGNYIEADSQETENAINDVNGTEVEVKEAVWGVDLNGVPLLLEEAEYEVVDISSPLEKILSGNVLLKQVVENSSDISSNRINTSSLASNRSLVSGTAQEDESTDSLWKKALFCKYALDHFDSYVDSKEAEQSGLEYSLEYLIGGMSADSQNMEVVVAELLAIREIDNYLTLLQDEAKRAEADVIGAAAASLVPWIGPVVAQGVLIYWAYQESVADLQKLLKGESVPLVKALGIEEIAEFTLEYEDYLYVLLLMQSREKLTVRAMDMIETDIRAEQSDFRMDACIGCASLVGTFVDIYDKKYTVTDKIQYD